MLEYRGFMAETVNCSLVTVGTVLDGCKSSRLASGYEDTRIIERLNSSKQSEASDAFTEL
jgi:hypothetical protein